MTAELARVVAKRINTNRPIILDGILILDALEQIGRAADFLIFVTGGHDGSSFSPQIIAYQSRRQSQALAHFTIEGCSE